MSPVFQSFAKINIGLRILGRRDDGYHNLETIFKLVDLHDRITIEPTDGAMVLTSDQSDVPTNESNLALKAVRLLERRTGQALRVRINIEKIIPMGAGLGGGSSNGAMTLVAINDIFRLGLSADELIALGSELGSDVPFFVGCYMGKGQTALGTGRGETLEFFNWDLTEQVVLVYPKVSISTAWAYQNYKKYKDLDGIQKTKNTLTNRGVSTILSAPLTKKTFFDNDFEPLVFANHDKIRLLGQSLYREGAIFCSLSGSGSTVYGLFPKDQSLHHIDRCFPDCNVYSCGFVYQPVL